MVYFLTNDDLARSCPAALAEGPSNRVSDRYNFVSTQEIIEHFDALGWGVRSATQPRSYKRSPDNKKHVLRFREYEEDLVIPDPRGGTALPEIVVINSSDGSSSLTVAGGLFACVCSNGLVVQTVDLGRFKSRHIRLDRPLLAETIMGIRHNFEVVGNKVTEMQGLRLNASQRAHLGNVAVDSRWGMDSGIVGPELLQTRREEDSGDDLWRVFNVVQENVIRGGFRSEARPRAIRELTNLDAVNRVNLELWEAAETLLAAA